MFLNSRCLLESIEHNFEDNNIYGIIFGAILIDTLASDILTSSSYPVLPSSFDTPSRDRVIQIGNSSSAQNAQRPSSKASSTCTRAVTVPLTFHPDDRLVMLTLGDPT